MGQLGIVVTGSTPSVNDQAWTKVKGRPPHARTSHMNRYPDTNSFGAEVDSTYHHSGYREWWCGGPPGPPGRGSPVSCHPVLTRRRLNSVGGGSVRTRPCHGSVPSSPTSLVCGSALPPVPHTRQPRPRSTTHLPTQSSDPLECLRQCTSPRI